MKTLIYLSISFLILGNNALNAQIIERYIYENAITETTHAVDANGFVFINKGVGCFEGQSCSSLNLLKLNYQLQTLDSLNLNALLSVQNNHYLTILKMEVQNATLQLLVNEQLVVQNQLDGYMHYVELDFDFNLKKNFEIKVPQKENLRLFDVCQKEDSLVLIGFLKDNKRYREALVTIDTNGNYGRHLLNADTTNTGSIYFQIIPFKNQFLLLRQVDFIFSDDRKSIYALDSNLQVVKSTALSNSYTEMINNVYFVPVDSNKVRLLSTSLSYPLRNGMNTNYTHYSVATITDSITNYAIDTFAFSGFDNYDSSYTVSPQPGFDSYDYRSTDSVISCLAGESESRFSNFYLKLKNNMYIHNYNATTNTMNWMRVYNSGYTNIDMTVAEALPGNRYLIGLNEYNWDKRNNLDTQIHLMILDANGNLLGAEESVPSIISLLLYPNPSVGFVRIKGLQENLKYRFRLVDVQGKEYYNEVQAGNTSFDFTKTPSGNYIFQVLDVKTGFGVAKKLVLQ